MDQISESRKYMKISSDMNDLFINNLNQINDYKINIKNKFNYFYPLFFVLGFILGVLLK